MGISASTVDFETELLLNDREVYFAREDDADHVVLSEWDGRNHMMNLDISRAQGLAGVKMHTQVTISRHRFQQAKLTHY
jgi:hypothetical protein